MPSRPAGAWIVAHGLVDELLVAVREGNFAFDLGLRRETFRTLAGDLESMGDRCLLSS